MPSKFAVVIVLALVPPMSLLGCGTPPHTGGASGSRSHHPQMLPLGKYVNPFIGTAGDGQVFPGAAMPFGMMQWSPDTSAGGLSKPGGYNHGDRIITGFSLTHLSGAGCSAFQDVPFLPTLRPIMTPPMPNGSPYSDRFVPTSERASPGYYGVRMASGIGVGVTVTNRTGIADFVFPASRRASVLVNAGGGGRQTGSATGAITSGVQIIGKNEVAGSATSGRFCGLSNRYTVYFAARFSRPFATFGTWTEHGVGPRTRRAAGSHSGAYLTFDTTSSHGVLVKVGLSFVSDHNARLNLQTENRGWSPSAVRRNAAAAWNSLLNRIQVMGGTTVEKIVFYTALYHSLLHPNIFSDANGEYIGFDHRVHRAAGYTHYANFSGWDIYRGQIQLVALLAPRATSDMMQSLLVDANEGGRLPKWPVANENTGEMNGDSADPIIANAYAFGARHFDTRSALRAMVNGATLPGVGIQGYAERPNLQDYLRLGYVRPVTGGWGAAATTLEFAVDDFSIAQLAKSLGRPGVTSTFMRRAQNWKHLFNPADRFLEPRLQNGAFPTHFNPNSLDGFVEGNAWQYRWMVPQNLRALFRALGGDRRVIKSLDTFFTELNAGQQASHDWAGNEPGLGIPWEYDFAGAPWRTQAVVRRILTTLYTASPQGLPGNDDLGTMSAWCVWAALGLYPEIPGVGGLVVGSPLFGRATLYWGDNSRIRLAAGRAGPNVQYVQSLRLDGHPYSRTWIPLALLRGRHTLRFELSSTPNRKWGNAVADRPPSFP